MKPTEEIIKNIDIDRYLEWIKDIYKGLEFAKYIQIPVKMINEMKLQEFRIKSYYHFKWITQEVHKEITPEERINKQTKLSKSFENREKMHAQQKQVTEYDKYLDYIFHFIPPGKWRNEPKSLRHLAKYINIDGNIPDYFISLINTFYQQDIDEIEQKEDVNKAYRQKKINEFYNKDYFILEHIINKTFIPIFGRDKTDKSDNSNILFEIAELKVLHTLTNEKPVTNANKINLSTKIQILNQLGYFELKHFLSPCKAGHIYKITALLLDANKDNVKDNILGLTSAKPKTGCNPNKYTDTVIQLLEY